MMKVFFSGIAKDTLRNNSVCIKDGGYIRNTNEYEDVVNEKLVFVTNVKPVNETVDYIEAGSMARYIVL